MNRLNPLRCALLVAIAASMLCGCLSIGGKTIHDNPETQSRLDSLESRVSSLERTLGGNH